MKTSYMIALGLLVASVFVLVVLGKIDAQTYMTLVLTLIGGIGVHKATTWQPSSGASTPVTSVAVQPTSLPAAPAAPTQENHDA